MMVRTGAVTIEHVDRYTAPSSVSSAGIFLAASSSSASTTPFFSGYLVAPQRSADLALTIAEVVRTRYYTPPGMLREYLPHLPDSGKVKLVERAPNSYGLVYPENYGVEEKTE